MSLLETGQPDRYGRLTGANPSLDAMSSNAMDAIESPPQSTWVAIPIGVLTRSFSLQIEQNPNFKDKFRMNLGGALAPPKFIPYWIMAL